MSYQSYAILALFICVACVHKNVDEPPPSTIKSVAVEPKNYAYLQQAGFTLVRKDGKQLYCTRSTTTGSHLEHTTTCLTPEEWQQVQDANKRTVEAVHDTFRLKPPGAQ
jgi:hypothetical protein